MSRYILDVERVITKMKNVAEEKLTENSLICLNCAVSFLNTGIECERNGTPIESVLPVKLIP